MIELDTITTADCLDWMKEIPDKSVDMIIADPPYGIGKSNDIYGKFGSFYAKRREYAENWDDTRPDKIYFDSIIRISKNAIIFGGNYFSDFLPKANHWIVWDKMVSCPSFSKCELIWTNINRKSVEKITIEWNGLLGKEKERLHPTQKPVELFIWILQNYAKQDWIVADPFCGSGTTAVACKRLGMHYLCCELDPHWADVARQRVAREDGALIDKSGKIVAVQPSLFKDE
jgi:site-specific DNA-methyltransferase (adenine-specific)